MQYLNSISDIINDCDNNPESLFQLKYDSSIISRNNSFYNSSTYFGVVSCYLRCSWVDIQSRFVNNTGMNAAILYSTNILKLSFTGTVFENNAGTVDGGLFFLEIPLGDIGF